MTVTIGLTFTNTLSIAPQSRKPTICRAIVERLTPSSRASPFHSASQHTYSWVIQLVRLRNFKIILICSQYNTPI